MSATNVTVLAQLSLDLQQVTASRYVSGKSLAFGMKFSY